MFGRGSEYGRATIVARQAHEGLYQLKAHTGIYRNIWDYIADVQPENGGEAFRATFTELFEGFDGREPDRGEQARVKFNPKDRKVEFDRSALLAEQAAVDTARKDEFAAVAGAAPSVGGAAPAAPTVDFSDTMAAIKRAREAGDLDEVERLKEAFRNRG